MFGNVVVLLVFQRKPQLLHVANRFVLNLLLADLLQTILVMPFAIAATVPGVWPLDARLCQALVVLMHMHFCKALSWKSLWIKASAKPSFILLSTLCCPRGKVHGEGVG